jgi:hypothetical protein
MKEEDMCIPRRGTRTERKVSFSGREGISCALQEVTDASTVVTLLLTASSCFRKRFLFGPLTCAFQATSCPKEDFSFAMLRDFL